MNVSGEMDHPLAPLSGAAAWTEAAPRPGKTPRPARPLLPWEDEDLSPLTGMRQTLGGLFARPGRFFESHRPAAGLVTAFVFGLICAATGLMLSLFLSALGLLAQSPPADSFLTLKFGGLVLGLILSPLAAIAWLVSMTLWTHFCLLLFGAGPRGLGASLRGVSYAAAAWLWLALPYLGLLLALVYGFIFAVAGLSRFHGVGRGRVAAALMAPPLGLMFLIALLFGTSR